MIESYVWYPHAPPFKRSRRGRPVNRNEEARLVNLFGAAALGLGDAIGPDAAAAAGLDATAATALVTLLDLARGGSIRSVSRLIGISHSGTVRLVNRMVDEGLVTRRAGQDGRTLAVTLTRRGRALADACGPSGPRRSRQLSTE